MSVEWESQGYAGPDQLDNLVETLAMSYRLGVNLLRSQICTEQNTYNDLKRRTMAKIGPSFDVARFDRLVVVASSPEQLAAMASLREGEDEPPRAPQGCRGRGHGRGGSR